VLFRRFKFHQRLLQRIIARNLSQWEREGTHAWRATAVLRRIWRRRVRVMIHTGHTRGNTINITINTTIVNGKPTLKKSRGV